MPFRCAIGGTVPYCVLEEGAAAYRNIDLIVLPVQLIHTVDLYAVKVRTWGAVPYCFRGLQRTD